MMKAIIVDIDGTLSNCEHRQHFLRQTPKDWKNFHTRCDLDTPNAWCVNLVWMYKEHGYKIILVSGRVNESLDKTLLWLHAYNVPNDLLFMRFPNDYRDDTIFKKEIYDKYIKGSYEVEFVLDDRRRLADMWRAEGLVVLHCAEGNF